jgi:hypothetical protein
VPTNTVLLESSPKKEELMKKDDFYPAKMLGKLQPKEERDKLTNTEAKLKEAAADEKEILAGMASVGTGADQPESARRGNSPLMDILSNSKGIGETGLESPFTKIMNGALDSLRGRAIHDIAQDIREVIVMSVSYALLIIGYYLLALFFDNDEKKALSKNPFKETSLNELARHRDMPFGRQRLGECVKAAAVDMELRRRGRTLSLTFYLLNEIARIKNSDLRVQIAEEAFARKLSLVEVKKKVDQLLGKTTSEDRRIGKTVIRQLKELVRLSTDEETQQFLMNKDRLKAAFGTGETVKLLDYSRQFRKGLTQSQNVLKQMEVTLADIVVENAKTDEENSDSNAVSSSISKTS